MKKRLLSIALVVAMIFAISSTALADTLPDPHPNPEDPTTATLRLNRGNDILPVGHSSFAPTGTFNFGSDHNARLNPETVTITANDRTGETPKTLTIHSTGASRTVAVSISPFMVHPGVDEDFAAYNVMPGFELNLGVANLVSRGGTTTPTPILGLNAESLSTGLVNFESETISSVFQAIMYLTADLIIPPYQANFVGNARAYLTWTSIPTVTPGNGGDNGGGN